MTKEEIIKLNSVRMDLSLGKIKRLSYKGQRELFESSVIYENNKKITFNDIDFSSDCVFISNVDLLSVISYIGLIKVNHVDMKDDTLTGLRSQIRTSYMIVTSNDAKMAYVSYGLVETDPDGWYLENYSNKDIVMWSLPKILGSGTDRDSNTIMNSINSLYELRRFNNKLNWMFFIGTEKEFNDIYRLSVRPNIYRIETKSLINNSSKGADVF